MSLRSLDDLAAATSFPRVSGDEPLQAPLIRGTREFSPRERG